GDFVLGHAVGGLGLDVDELVPEGLEQRRAVLDRGGQQQDADQQGSHSPKIRRKRTRDMNNLLLALLLCHDGIVQVEYPPSTQPGELQFGVTYTVWIPEGVPTLRGVIVHQHGCGTGACKGGATAATDLHWQALAKKWDCALLGPSYHQDDKQNCRLWCDPRNGSRAAFLKALGEFAERSKHPELRS